MSEAKVTVAIPTYNRSQLLKLTIENILHQDYTDLRVVVLDNASVDDTEAVVRSFADRDRRVTYVRNETNIGVLNNWNRALALNSPYLTILSDDDVMLQGFIRESVRALDEHPRAAFSFTLARQIDLNGALLNLQDPGDVPDGAIDGLDFLDLVVACRSCIIYTSTVFMRTAAQAVVGPFDSPHTNHTFDFTMYSRLAAHFDLVFLRQELVHVRLHPGQLSQNDWRSTDSTGPFGAVAELIDAGAYLLQSDRAQDALYRQWLAERLLALNARKSEYMRSLVPRMHDEWTERLQRALQEIVESIPSGKTFILVDEAQWGIDGVGDRHAIPFLERDGQYWGPPLDDGSALSELQRLRGLGASFIVFGWTAFWWLDYYSGLHRFLCSQCQCVLKNSRITIFDLQLVCQELGNKERGTVCSPNATPELLEEYLFE